MERLKETSRDRTGPPRPDLASVHLDHRDDLGRGSRQETLLGIPDIVTGQVPFLHLQTKVRGQFKHDLAGDAAQGPGRGIRGQHPALAHHEKVVPGAFRHMPQVVQHDRLERPVLGGLDLRENIVEVVQRLDPGIKGGGGSPPGRHGDDGEAVPVDFGWVELDAVGDDDDRRLLAGRR